MKMSPRGLASVVREEAIVLFVYEDTDTKGVRHRANGIGNNDDSLDLSSRITVDEAVAQFLENIRRFEAVVDRTITRKLAQNEYDALVHRAFNSGVRGFEVGERDLIDAVNRDDDRAVVMELVRDGNLARRIREANMYVSAYYNSKMDKVRLYENDLRHFVEIPNPILEK